MNIHILEQALKLIIVQKRIAIIKWIVSDMLLVTMAKSAVSLQLHAAPNDTNIFSSQKIC